VSVLLPVNAISTSNPDPYAIDGDEPKCDEFSRGRPPEFELDKETQLKVPASSPSLKELELPEHVNVLFLQIVEDIDLPDDTVQDLKSLLYDHRDTFASSSTDLGYCPLVEHDIDTGDSRPIKQSPRRPPIAAREAEDEILRMLKRSLAWPPIIAGSLRDLPPLPSHLPVLHVRWRDSNGLKKHSKRSKL